MNLPRYFTTNEVRLELDKHRRRYRRAVVWLVVYQVAVLGPIRYALDTLIRNPKFSKMLIIEPYIVPGMVLLVVLIWALGLPNAFRRRY